jgi:hypothetical protein
MENESIPVYLNRSQFADFVGIVDGGRSLIINRFARRKIRPDATDMKGAPLFLVDRIPELIQKIAYDNPVESIDTQPEPQA